jgi:hypothetical protein
LEEKVALIGGPGIDTYIGEGSIDIIYGKKIMM